MIWRLRKQGKRFFFKKKNQKTLVNWSCALRADTKKLIKILTQGPPSKPLTPCPRPSPQDKSFLLLFFKKEALPFACPVPSLPKMSEPP
jgi:hypothetical protein